MLFLIFFSELIDPKPHKWYNSKAEKREYRQNPAAIYEKMGNYAWVKAAARDFVLFQHQEQEVKKCGRNNYWQLRFRCALR